MGSLTVDLLVVGWGKAGKTLAGRYAAAGHAVALVERSPSMYGGSCINVACVPTKDLVVSAEARRAGDDPAAYFANMFQRFGSRVTVLEGAGTFLPRAERDVAESVHSVLTGRGIDIRTDVRVQRLEETVDGVTVVLGDASVEADAVLVAVGRTPATADLNLAVAGIATDEHGFVVVDDPLRTSVDGVFAVGDINGGPQFTYISLDDYRIVWDALAGEGSRCRRWGSPPRRRARWVTRCWSPARRWRTSPPCRAPRSSVRPPASSSSPSMPATRGSSEPLCSASTPRS